MAWPADWLTGEVITAARLKQWTDAQKVWPDNVGVGISSPADRLTFGELSYAPSQNGPCVRWQSTGGELIYRMGARINASGVGRIAIDGYSGLGTYTERLCINDSGNVGIGTTSPDSPLQVETVAAGIPIALRIRNSQTVAQDVGARLLLQAGAAGNGLAAISAAFSGAAASDGAYLSFATRTPTTGSMTERVRISADGKVTLTATPVYADNAAAVAGGLTAGMQYRTAAGVRMEVF